MLTTRFPLLDPNILKELGFGEDELTLVLTIPKDGRPTSTPPMQLDDLARIAADTKRFMRDGAVYIVKMTQGGFSVHIDGPSPTNDYAMQLIVQSESQIGGWLRELEEALMKLSTKDSLRVVVEELYGAKLLEIQQRLWTHLFKPGQLRTRVVCKCCLVNAFAMGRREIVKDAPLFRYSEVARLVTQTSGYETEYSEVDMIAALPGLRHEDRWYPLLVAIYERVMQALFEELEDSGALIPVRAHMLALPGNTFQL